MNSDGPEFIEYQCRGCQELTLADDRADHARYRECLSCFAVPDLKRRPVDHRLPSLRWAIATAPLDLTNPQSEGQAEAARGAASAPSGAEAEAGAERGLAPDRAARAHEGVPTGTTENERRSPPDTRARATRADGGSPVATRQVALTRWSSE